MESRQKIPHIDNIHKNINKKILIEAKRLNLDNTLQVLETLGLTFIFLRAHLWHNNFYF
jgi:hypothetical protein